MTHTSRYIQWQTTNFSLNSAISDAVTHWQARYELGTALLLTEDPTMTLRLAQKQWRKLTRQLQQERTKKTDAEDILSTTRTISRMQRVKFSAKDPLQNPDANFYIINPKSLNTLPTNCFTLYSFTTLPAEPVIALLAPDALVVAYKEQMPPKNLISKSVLEEHVLSVEAELLSWLEKHHIDIEIINTDIEKANEALDTILGSTALQAEFLSKTKLFLHTIQLASPLKMSSSQKERLETLEQLEKHVRVLSPAYLSDHILDSQNDDSFLLRDLSKKNILTISALRDFIANQYKLGHTHLAHALEQKVGFISI